jgi:hypothetical protein
MVHGWIRPVCWTTWPWLSLLFLLVQVAVFDIVCRLIICTGASTKHCSAMISNSKWTLHVTLLAWYWYLIAIFLVLLHLRSILRGAKEHQNDCHTEVARPMPLFLIFSVQNCCMAWNIWGLLWIVFCDNEVTEHEKKIYREISQHLMAMMEVFVRYELHIQIVNYFLDVVCPSK